jgi:predicted small lipoprotein YifL
MKRTLAIALLLGLAACGDKAPLEATAAETVTPKALAASAPEPIKPAAVPATPAKSDADKDLEKRVARAIQAGKLHGIDVEASDGAVILFGTAVSAKERDRAARIAAKVDGVKTVDSRLQIVTGS